MTSQDVQFRPACKEDCRLIAQLYSMATDGVADYIWSTLAEAGEDILDVGTRRYMREDIPFSYKNCIVADLNGKVIGMLVSYPIILEKNNVDDSKIDPVLLPYQKLEEDQSYYICGVAFFPEYRGKGLGTKFLQIAEQKAKEAGLKKLSLIVFEQNSGAKKLYERYHYKVVARAPVVPHKLIHCTGDALLMVKEIEK